MNQSNAKKVVLYLAISLDGYIALPDGSVDWLMDVKGDGGDNGYAEFYGTVGTIIMGRQTYDEMLKLTDEFPYPGKPCYVVTRNPSGQKENAHVTFTNEALTGLVQRLQKQTEGAVWLAGGGKLVQAFMEERLMDEAMIAVVPKVLGRGIPLFPQGTVPSTFELHDIKRLGDIAMLHYKVH
ncbi:MULTISPECIES: dihydrofolate reductase family protein [Paenibacillus]|uniref:Bacterial bifunctional deaminase-reductase C-terminal domain-containing protein n=1 Tax=Paenibacillus albilobatus TaxID=2716884 RepID=A0A919XBG5_9BACL|nr:MULTISPECIES: dihydrofolate reductase family protein [Paenibacillus]GIO29071.1 hypothetical protein J2TS6_02120 [Paenibacillus albilobatus]